MRSDNGLGFLDLSVGGTGDSVELDSTDGDEGATGEDGISRANDDIAGIGGNSGRPCRELDEAPSAVFGGGDGGEPPSCRGVLARGSIVYAAVITSTDHSRRSSRRLQRSYLTGWATAVLFCVAGTGVRLEAPLIGKYTTHAAHFPSRCPTRSIG